jgi:hypothetical protein
MVRESISYLRQKKNIEFATEDEYIEHDYDDEGEQIEVKKINRRSIFDNYRGLSLIDLLEQSKKPFNTSRDLHELRKEQGTLFDSDMDVEFDCFCKST